MGTIVSASSYTQMLNIRSIVGGFIIILIILAFYNLFKSNCMVKMAAFLTITGVVIVSSLILLTSAISYMVNINLFGVMI